MIHIAFNISKQHHVIQQHCYLSWLLMSQLHLLRFKFSNTIFEPILLEAYLTIIIKFYLHIYYHRYIRSLAIQSSIQIMIH